jgi:lipoprotein-anchoring transpeptidase ErfK/SrfK
LVVGVLGAPAGAAAGSVDALSPTHGPVGTLVDITGSGLATATDVTFDAVDAGAPTVVDDTHIQSTVPSGATSGVVRVATAGGTLDGPSFTVQLPTSGAVALSRGDVVFTHRAVVTATLTAGGVAVRDQRARLQRAIRGSHNWHFAQGARRTGKYGRVHWSVTPRKTSSYRVRFSTSKGYRGTTTRATRLHVHPLVQLHVPQVAPILTATTLRGAVRPRPAHGSVVLFRRQHGGAWQRIGTASVARQVHYRFDVSFDSTGSYAYKAGRASDATHAAGRSPVHRLRAVQRTLHSGMSGPDVRALQRRLHALHYDVGQISGSYGYDTQHAVVAFEKVQGLDRDGVVGLEVWKALDRPHRLHLHHAADASTAGVEVDLKHQVVLYAVHGHVHRILDASTGGGYYYTGSDGTQQKAVTPTGHFKVVYKREGWVTSDLGTLYRPAYFNYDGYAIHGEDQVPSYPASHGCVRITVPAMDRMYSKLYPGISVWIY